MGTIENGTGLWHSPNTGATNETGFSAVSSGTRYGSGPFSDIGYYGFWWSSTEYYSLFAWYWVTDHTSGYISGSQQERHIGFSVRCVRD